MRKNLAKKSRKVMIIGTNVMSIYAHRLELIERLLTLGFEVVVLCPDNNGDSDRLRHLGCKVDTIQISPRGKSVAADYRLLRSICRHIDDERPDIIFTFYTKTNIYGGMAARIKKVPYVVNVTGLGSGISNGGMMQKLMMRLYMTSVRDASRIFFQNSHDFEFFRTYHVDEKRCGRLPGSGVSLHRFYPLPYPAEEEPVTFAFISRMLEEKGIEEYLKAAEIIKESSPEVRFLAVGPCDDVRLSALLDDYAARGIIIRYPQSSDIHSFLEMCQCTVYPSYYGEGMANILLESAASGRPVITTSRPGCGETVEDGVTGFIVKQRDTTDLVRQLQRFLALPYSKRIEMGRKGRRKMEQEFNRNIVVDEYVRITNQVLDK